MKKFINIDPVEVQKDPRVCSKYIVYTSDEGDNDYLYTLVDDSHLVFVTASIYYSRKTGEKVKKLLGGTDLEIPKSALPWFVDAVENKFGKTEAEGGLPKGSFGCEKLIQGEKLIISRMFGVPGYSFRNHSRHSYFFEDSTDPQDLPLSDELLFEKGFFKELKKLANKIDMGEI